MAVNAYTSTFAVLVVTGAALGDRFGRRRMLVVGLGLFTLGSGAAALSSSIGWLRGAVRTEWRRPWRPAHRRPRQQPRAALGAVAPAEQGQASGATVAIRELAVVLGVTIAGSVFAAHGSFAGAASFAFGFRAAVGVMALAALAGAALALALLSARKLRPAPDAELAIDVAEVPLDRLGAHAQVRGDLPVAAPGGGQLGHAALGGREAVAPSGA